MRGCVVVVALMLAACRHGSAIPPVPSKGGPAWIEVTSDHFVMWTDAGRDRARALIQDMERHRQVVLGVAFNYPGVSGKAFVVALRDQYELEEFLPENVAAYAWRGSVLPIPAIVLQADADEDRQELVTHELSHAISFNVIRNQPKWFAEGLAEFFASVELDPRTGRGTVGKAPKVTMQRLRDKRPSPIAAMFGCNELGCGDELYYPTAWAMFAYLANVRAPDLLRYAARLDEVPRAQMAGVWTEVFPDLTAERFDGLLKQWLYSGKHQIWSFETKLEKPTLGERPLGDADVLAARALIRYTLKPADPRARTEVTAALAADQNHVLAQLILGALDDRYDPAVAHRVATAHADDWRAWWLVMLANPQSSAGAEAAAKICTLAKGDPALLLPPEVCAAR